MAEHMEEILNIVRREVERVFKERKHVRHGLVDSYDKKKHAVKVKFMPEGQISGWIPIGTTWMGNQWGDFSPPSPGDHATVHYEHGDVGTAVFNHRHWNDVDKPLEVEAGERWIVHKSGSYIKFKNDGTIIIAAKGSQNGETDNPQQYLKFTPDGDMIVNGRNITEAATQSTTRTAAQNMTQTAGAKNALAGAQVVTRGPTYLRDDSASKKVKASPMVRDPQVYVVAEEADDDSYPTPPPPPP